MVGTAAVGRGAGGDLCSDGGRPPGWPDRFPTEEVQEKERRRLFQLIKELVKLENTTNEVLLQQTISHECALTG